MEVEPGVKLICMGDFNGRMKILETRIESDQNGKMIEEWINQGLHHLNQSEKFTGTYRYGTPGKPKSAIDHILVNCEMKEKFSGMSIDEIAEEINMSDHNLLRAWFKIGRGETIKWEKKSYEIRSWYKKMTNHGKKWKKTYYPE